MSVEAWIREDVRRRASRLKPYPDMPDPDRIGYRLGRMHGRADALAGVGPRPGPDVNGGAYRAGYMAGYGQSHQHAGATLEDLASDGTRTVSCACGARRTQDLHGYDTGWREVRS